MIRSNINDPKANGGAGVCGQHNAAGGTHPVIAKLFGQLYERKGCKHMVWWA